MLRKVITNATLPILKETLAVTKAEETAEQIASDILKALTEDTAPVVKTAKRGRPKKNGKAKTIDVPIGEAPEPVTTAEQDDDGLF